MKPTSIQTEIISLLHSPELQAYLLASPELLQATDYAELIAGAPLGLSKKLELLEKLEESLADSEDAELVHIYVECVEEAMEPLEKPYEQLFCAQFYAANDERERSFGPYYVRSWDVFPEIIQEQREADNEAWNILHHPDNYTIDDAKAVFCQQTHRAKRFLGQPAILNRFWQRCRKRSGAFPSFSMK